MYHQQLNSADKPVNYIVELRLGLRDFVNKILTERGEKLVCPKTN